MNGFSEWSCGWIASFLVVATVSPCLTAQQSELVSEEETARIFEELISKADYVFVGKLRGCQALGRGGNETDEPRWFFRLSVEPENNLLGNLRNDSKSAMALTHRPFPDDWSFKALFITGDKTFAVDQSLDYLVIVKRTIASTMAGSIPLSITYVATVDKTQLEMAKTTIAGKTK